MLQIDASKRRYALRTTVIAHARTTPQFILCRNSAVQRYALHMLPRQLRIATPLTLLLLTHVQCNVTTQPQQHRETELALRAVLTVQAHSTTNAVLLGEQPSNNTAAAIALPEASRDTATTQYHNAADATTKHTTNATAARPCSCAPDEHFTRYRNNT
mgnify:CR=1 FL=1